MVSSSLTYYHAGNSKPPQSNAHTQERYPKALVIAAIVTSVILWASAFPARSAYNSLPVWRHYRLVWCTACQSTYYAVCNLI
ncbi:MAG: hypothetical protein HXY43_09520 [Fischerella sp.]|jgi:hypothetical protein|uniref:hypothetical protein n=1 Tax=Fischerella sp. TaxID=1191 RepID=UPI0017B55692|nr:hypothetical protein [Fischerella sp.]NWF59518.1 hypothetical protein [Fischerella sp.]